MSREVNSGARLTPMESLMWRLEGTRALSATFGSVTFLDREPDRSTFTERLGTAANALPRLRQRIDTGGPPGTAPTWVDHREFALDHHLRWQVCPGSGSEHDVLQLVTELVETPFDPNLPPWEFVVVTGLADGRAALVQRMHHAITDGKGGIRLSEHFIDLERNPPRPPSGPAADEFPRAVPPPSLLERTLVTASGHLVDAARTTIDAARWVGGGIADPGRFGALGAEVVETTRSLHRQLAVVDRARSPLWTHRSGVRHFTVGSVPFAAVRAAATDAGTSINDVFVTATLRGAAAYHRSFGSAVTELRVAVPVSTRDNTSAGGNSFSPTRALLPSGEGLTAAAHLRAVSAAMSQTKRERATGLIEPVAAIAELVPAPALQAMVKRQAATIDYTASNLRAAPVPLFIAGAMIEATYAVGPLAGTAANITMMSYNGRIDIGIHVDVGAVTEPELLRDTVIAALHEVCEGSNALT